jgi:hypothetical protein
VGARVSRGPSSALRANAAEFALSSVLNALVGGMVGLERSVLPLVGKQDFGLSSTSAILAFVVAFGAAKAVTNLAAGGLAERLGPQAASRDRLVGGAAGAAADRARALVVVHRRRQPAARRQPGIRLVDDGGDEDRPGRAAAARARARAERIGRLPGRRPPPPS